MLLSLFLSLSPFLVVILSGLLVLATDGPLQAEQRSRPASAQRGRRTPRQQSEWRRARATSASTSAPTTLWPRTVAPCSSTARLGKPTFESATAGLGSALLPTSTPISLRPGRFTTAAAVGSPGDAGREYEEAPQCRG